MKYETRFGSAEPISARSVMRRGLELLFVIALVAGGVLSASIAYVYGAESVKASVPLLLVGWVASIGVAFALPFLVVRAVSATLAALRL